VAKRCEEVELMDEKQGVRPAPAFTEDEVKTLEAGGVVDRGDGNQYFSVQATARANRAREKELEKITVSSLKEKSRARAHRELRKKVRKNKKKRMVR
jgi:hypothetical protein